LVGRPVGAVAVFLLMVQPVGLAGPMMAVAAIASEPVAARIPKLEVVRAQELAVAMARALKLAEEKGPVMSYS
jgi:hypothetical protein